MKYEKTVKHNCRILSILFRYIIVRFGSMSQTVARKRLVDFVAEGISSSLRDFIVLVFNIEVFQIKFSWKKESLLELRDSKKKKVFYFESLKKKKKKLRPRHKVDWRTWSHCWWHPAAPVAWLPRFGHPCGERGWWARTETLRHPVPHRKYRALRRPQERGASHPPCRCPLSNEKRTLHAGGLQTVVEEINL